MQCPGQVGHVKGSARGAKQACAACARGINQRLQRHGFTQCKTDAYIYKLAEGGSFVKLLASVGDFLVIASGKTILQTAKGILRIKCEVKDMGPATSMLQWKVERAPARIKISQPACISKMLADSSMSGCKSSPAPYCSGLGISSAQDSEPTLTTTQAAARKRIIGSLRCLADSARPGISCITGALAMRAMQPSQRRWRAIQRALRHLKSATRHGIICGAKDPQLKARSGSGCAGRAGARRSAAGSIFEWRGGPISWKSSCQKSAALSATDGESIAASEAARHATWLRRLLREMGHAQHQPTPLRLDNQSTIRISTTKDKAKKSKRIDFKRHCAREKHEDSAITIRHIPAADMKADFLTKQLTPPKRKHNLTITNITSSPP